MVAHDGFCAPSSHLLWLRVVSMRNMPLPSSNQLPCQKKLLSSETWSVILSLTILAALFLMLSLGFKELVSSVSIARLLGKL